MDKTILEKLAYIEACLKEKDNEIHSDLKARPYERGAWLSEYNTLLELFVGNRYYLWWVSYYFERKKALQEQTEWFVNTLYKMVEDVKRVVKHKK